MAYLVVISDFTFDFFDSCLLMFVFASAQTVASLGSFNLKRRDRLIYQSGNHVNKLF